MKIKKSKLDKIFKNVSNKKIVVIGDYMLDAYLWGNVERISPEAPVPVVQVEKTNFLPGGAANVVQNISKLGATAYPIGIVGNDANGKKLLEILEKMNVDASGIVIDEKRPTTIKTRIMAQNQQVVRVDEESQEDISKNIEQKLISIAEKAIKNADGVIFEDYNKGALTSRLVKKCIKMCNAKKIFTTVDPKKINFGYFKGASLIKPNKVETSHIVKRKLNNSEDIHKAAKEILKKYNIDAVLITLGEAGMLLHEKNGDFTQLSSSAKRVFDVTGAGDTVISSVSVLKASGATLKEAAFIANKAAGIVVENIGTATVTLNQLRKECR